MPELRKSNLLAMCSHYSASDRQLLLDAIDFAFLAHEGQVRKASGAPYVIHPLEIALVLEQKFADPVLTIAGLLHDTVEDNAQVHMKDIYAKFGKEIGFLVDSVTKTELGLYGSDHVFPHYRDKFLYGGMRDVRVLILKIADRDNNLETIDTFRIEKQLRISFETQAIYLPLLRILEYREEGRVIEEIQEKFHVFLSDHQISSSSQLEQLLLAVSFDDVTGSVFDEIYSCSENVVWEIGSLDQFELLCQDPDFDACARIVDMESNGVDTKIRFKMVKAHLPHVQSISKFGVTRISTI